MLFVGIELLVIIVLGTWIVMLLHRLYASFSLSMHMRKDDGEFYYWDGWMDE